ncbi:hypothetical protein KUCAC02_021792 [Chaenocephalus aceratus]|uniref:Uncharacterized protein n=1 Tax=Chaenocephalus aceratus TaxID=36190 RepID=A0ACB9XI94_CHAAC|nr:hypothetical protein KUCAC02_021792 [Chaenocephalus aceratus]
MKIENRDRELPTERRGQEEKKAEGTTLRALLCSSATLKMGYAQKAVFASLQAAGVFFFISSAWRKGKVPDLGSIFVLRQRAVSLLSVGVKEVSL